MIGYLQNTTIEFPLRGQGAISFALVKEDGTPLVLDATYNYSFGVFTHADDTVPLFALTGGSGLTLLTPFSAGIVYLSPTGPQLALMNAQQAYIFQALVSDAMSAPILAQAGTLLPVLTPSAKSYLSVGGGNTGFLSNRTINVLALAGEAGGAGYLDGIITVGQPITPPCIVEWIDTTTGRQTGWVLENSSDATVAGSKRRPLDYNSSIPRCWRSLY